MANEKFSDFTLATDLTNIEGFVGFQAGVDNYQITPDNLALTLPVTRTYTGTLRDIGDSTANKRYAHFTPDLSGINNNFGGLPVEENITIVKIQMKYVGITADALDTGLAGDEWGINLTTLTNNTDAIDSAGTAQLTNPASLRWTDADDGGWPYKEWTGSVDINAGSILRLSQANVARGDFTSTADVAFII